MNMSSCAMNTEPDDESLLIFPSLSHHLASHDHVKISKHNHSEKLKKKRNPESYLKKLYDFGKKKSKCQFC